MYTSVENLRPLRDWVIVEVERKELSSTLVVVTKDICTTGTVVRVGNQVEVLTPGVDVLFQPTAMHREEDIDGKTYYWLREADITGIIPKSE